MPRTVHAYLLLSIAVVAVSLGARPCRAAGCCTSATSFGVGRLLVWEDFAVGLQLGHARVLGNWTPGASLRANPADYAEGISHGRLWSIVRLHQRFEVQAFLPVLLNDRRSGGTRQLAGGLGDIGAAVRFQVLAIGELHRVPSLALITGFTAPTGRRVEETSPPLFAGTTGMGAWAGSAALESELALHPWFVRLDLGGWLYRSFVRADTGERQRPGPALRAAISAGRKLGPRWVLAGALSADWQAAVRIAGDSVPDSEAHLVTTAASASFRASPHWTLIGTLSNSVLPDGFGKNRDARIDGTLGIRYGHF
jgi:hypothetical protein